MPTWNLRQRAPIVASGNADIASVVIGVVRCGFDPGGHDGRWLSEAGGGGKSVQGHGEGLAIRFPAQACPLERLLIAERREADARELVGQRTGGFVVVGAALNGQRPGSQGIQRPATVEYALCQVHSDSRSIHLGLLPGCADTHTT